jgi:hypothetical protein
MIVDITSITILYVDDHQHILIYCVRADDRQHYNIVR